MKLGNLAPNSMFFNYSVSLPPLGHQKESWKVPSPQLPAHQATVPASRSEALHQDAPELIPHVPPHPEPKGWAGGIFHRPLPVGFPPSSASPFPGPSALCHPLTPTLCSLPDFLPPPSTTGTRNGASTPRPGSFATTCKGKFSTDPRGQQRALLPWIPGARNFQGAFR